MKEETLLVFAMQLFLYCFTLNIFSY